MYKRQILIPAIRHNGLLFLHQLVDGSDLIPVYRRPFIVPVSGRLVHFLSLIHIFAENQAKGSTGSYAQVLSAIVERDRLDTSRAASPLVKAKDAVELDTTHMTLAQVANRVVELARAAWEGNRA